MKEQKEWPFYEAIDWDDHKNNRFNIDTRDFHCGYYFEKESHKDIKTIKKLKEDFFFSKEELVSLIDRYYKESGGKGEWRYFDLEVNNANVNNWNVKYLRIFREDGYGFFICNKDSYALNKSILSAKVALKYLHHH